MLWSFLPALLAPISLWLTIALVDKFHAEGSKVEALLLLIAALSPFWILFCVSRIHTQQTPGSPGSTLAEGCGLFFLLLLANGFAGIGLVIASCAAAVQFKL